MENIVITIFDKEIHNLEKLVELFANEGMTINYVFEFGVIIGTADQFTIERLKTHEEIESIDVEKTVDLSPPDSEVQCIERAI
jgi:hypothetical protein